MLARQLSHRIEQTLAQGLSVLIFGARQTGKTTLAKSFSPDKEISFVNLEDTLRFERHPETFIQEIKALANTQNKTPLVLCDEIQKAPKLIDAVQYLIDQKQAKFILTGSSARKIRKQSSINLLPGRVITFYMDPLSTPELPQENLKLESLLNYGSLPGVMTQTNTDLREQLLRSYSQVYLEEEIKAEALVKDLGNFSEFLELAALDSGNSVNFSKLSQQIAVSHNTIKNYYDILEDCLITYRVPAYCHSPTKRRLTKASKYLFFDLGVRRLCAKTLYTNQPDLLGRYLEQWVGLELIRYQHQAQIAMGLYYWRDHNGAEVDYIVKVNQTLIPVEVKLTKTPNHKTTKHLLSFINEYHSATHGFVICDCKSPLQLEDNIIALPWRQITDIFERDITAS